LTLDLIFLALPIFFAGVLFATFLDRASSPSSALGYNLLGVMVGGVLEYSSMAWGINNLNMVSIAVYVAGAFVAYRESKRLFWDRSHNPHPSAISSTLEREHKYGLSVPESVKEIANSLANSHPSGWRFR
jgi:hypothetical protein